VSTHDLARPEHPLPHNFHLSVEEREGIGRDARKRFPRRALGGWVAPVDRVDPVSLLAQQETSRIQELLPLRHERMGVSAFTFYRGSAIVMASDLATRANSGLTVQLCGDAHLSNFGLFAAPDRQPVFDINDFDETNAGPFEWDVLRLATSFVLAAIDNGFSEDIGIAAAKIAARRYQTSMAAYSSMHEIDIWYDRVDAATLDSWADAAGGKQARKAVDRVMRKARKRDTWSALSKMTEIVNGKRQFINNPPTIVNIPDNTGVYNIVSGVLDGYLQTLQVDRRVLIDRYKLTDIGHKVVGVGSVGLLAWVLLLEGRDSSDLLALQVKQAQASVLEAHSSKSPFPHHGQRVVEGQRLTQAASDAFLGWVSGEAGRQYYVRQLRDMKWSPDPSSLTPVTLGTYADLCGHVLARAHARSGDSISIAGFIGVGDVFVDAVASFSQTYSEQVSLDFAEFQEAVSDGRLVGPEHQLGKEQWSEYIRDIADNPPDHLQQ
jgi:uncharacterized protein (DUF2252 family)